jgi:hypothetical protein
MNRNRTVVGVVLIAVLMGVVSESLAAASLWTLSGGGVWDIPAGKRVAWNPAAGAIGNMGDGVVFNVAAAPANVQAGAAAQAASGYTFWNSLAAIPSVNIKFVAGAAAASKSTTSWGALAGTTLGSTGNVAVNFNPRNITLNNTLTLRSDGWNVFNPAGGAAVKQFDTFSVNVHEAGHVLGLNHPGSITQIMTQTGASLAAGGRYDAVKQTTPFAGQPLGLNAAGVAANALPNVTPVYQNPRNAFGAGDALGAITLYSAPISALTSFFTPLGAGRGLFTYTVTNNSAHGLVAGTQLTSGYNETTFSIPVDPRVPISNMVAPSGYSITRESNDVLVKAISPSFELVPGASLQFSFESTDSVTTTVPSENWSILGLGTDSTIDNSVDADSEDPPATPAFDFTNFGVLDGTYTYEFNNAIGDWQMVRLSDVLTPNAVPEPETYAMLLAGLGLLGFMARRREQKAA